MSYRKSGPFDDLRNSIMRSGAPATAVILFINLGLLIADAFAGGRLVHLLDCAIFDGRPAYIWQPVTYPLLTPSFIELLINGLFMWTLGGSLERSWGRQRFVGFFAGISILTSVCLMIGTRLLHTEAEVAGLSLPLISMLCAWAAINPRFPVRVYFILILEARWIALILVGIVFFVDFAGQPILGLFALVSPALSWLYVRGGWSVGQSMPRRGPDLRIVGGKAPNIDGSRGGGPMGWLRERQERKRLEKLWKDSGFSDGGRK